MPTLTATPDSTQNTLLSCHCCGLVQRRPAAKTARLRCARCHTALHTEAGAGSRAVQIFALCALIFYLPAMILPMLRVERLGHARQDSLLGGVENLLSQGYWLVGGVVFLFSVLLPPIKLFALLWLTRPVFLRHHQRALIYRWAEHLGRWGMLDVLLVAILIAFVKLGDLITITAGPGLTAFILLVVFSLLASLVFNPRAMWSTTNGRD